MDNSPNLRDRLTELFRQAGPAHHKAFIQTDGNDPEWPIWYADHLHDALEKLLNTNFTRSEIIALLVQADKSHRREAPRQEWSEFYADFFMNQAS
jgi:hypothetical protein